jgi:hypothetical protein
MNPDVALPEATVSLKMYSINCNFQFTKMGVETAVEISMHRKCNGFIGLRGGLRAGLLKVQADCGEVCCKIWQMRLGMLRVIPPFGPATIGLFSRAGPS